MSCSNADRSKHGYLLLELLLAMAIFGIASALVFRIIQTATKTTQEAQLIQVRTEKIDGIDQTLRFALTGLPATAEFVTIKKGNDLELAFGNAAFQFSWQPGEVAFGALLIETVQQGDGRYALQVAQIANPDQNLSLPELAQGKDLPWTTVAADLDRLSWRFFDGRSNKWVDDWTDPLVKPELIELTFQASGDPLVRRAVYHWAAGRAGP
jgi:prepilin-type N-terminal cleavage/methylation domain-containing protein